MNSDARAEQVTLCHVTNGSTDRNGDLLWVRAEHISEESEHIGGRTPCGGGFEYLHRSPASRRRRRKGNPVPGGITVPPCYWGDINTGTWPSRFGDSRIWDSKIWSWARGTRTREWLLWRGPAAFVNDRPILSSQKMLYKDYNRKR
jgi:hypothetical protein